MKKLITVLTVILLLTNVGQGQTGYLKTVKNGTVRTNYEFTNEWQYVSSDLYMFNAERMADLLNQIITGKKRKFLRKKDKDIQNILITLKLQGLGDYDNITYPLYNFVVSHDEQGNYQMQTSTNDVIRIIDNFPAPAIDDFISAKVDVKVITKDNTDEVYKIAAEQLKTISMLAEQPAAAVLKLVGEFGKVIENTTDHKEYQFSSTIRIYQDENFNQQLHSITVFTFIPSNKNEFKIDIDLSDLQKYIDENPNPKINRKILYEKIKCKKYPYIVIVNYKSKYIPTVPDDITFESLKAREAKLKANYDKGVINEDIYALEKELLEYLKLYAQLKLDLNNYELNLKNKITEDYSMFYFLIMRDYWKMKKYYASIDRTEKDNPAYRNEFKKIYDRIMTKANIALEQNNNLREVREMTNMIYYLENTPIDQIPMDTKSIETYLEKLYAVPMPKREANSPELKTVYKWINYLEQNLFDKKYKKQLEELSMLPVNEESYEKIVRYQNENTATNCELCRQEISKVVDSFMKKYEQYQLDKAKSDFEETKLEAQNKLIGFTKTLDCLKENLKNYPVPRPEYISLLEQNALKIEEQKNSLQALVNKNYLFTSTTEIQNTTKEISGLTEKIEKDLNNLCAQEDKICVCGTYKKPEIKEEEQVSDTTKTPKAKEAFSGEPEKSNPEK